MNEADRHRDRSLGPAAGKAYFFSFSLIPSFNLGVSQMNARQYEEALKNLAFAINSLPNLTEGYYIMGLTYIRLRDFPKAVASLERAGYLMKRGYRKEISVIDVFTAMYDSYVNQQPPDHNNGLRVLEQLLLLYPNNLRQLFNHYHIKQYISSLNNLLPLKRRAVQELHTQEEKFLKDIHKGVLPPLTPIRASVFASMSLLSEVNKHYEIYSHILAEHKLYKHKAVKGMFTLHCLQ